MLKREREILFKFRDERAVYSNNLQFVFNQEHDLSTIVKMCNDGFLINDGQTVRLTKKGYDAAQEIAENEAAEHAKEEANAIEKKKNRRKSFASELFKLVFGWVVGIVRNNYGKLIEFFGKLFEMISQFFH